MSDTLLAVSDLTVRFDADEGTTYAVDRLSFTLGRGGEVVLRVLCTDSLGWRMAVCCG